MKNSVKVIAMYLPQYHVIPENSQFWGEGYTDWEAVKNSKPVFKGHNQPRVPLNYNYYDLSKESDIRKQVSMANKYGIYGFGIYHYWFSSEKQLLEKPGEIILKNKDIPTHFFFCWDNSSWKRTWSNVKIGNDWAPLYENKETIDSSNQGILAELKYGTEVDWKKHFDYLLNFFKDERYIKIGNRPVFSILNQDNDSNVLKNMCCYWNQLAIENGFDGIAFLGKSKNNSISFTEYTFHYEPEWNGWTWHNQLERVIQKIEKMYKALVHKEWKFDYDLIWKRIIRSAKKCNNKNEIFCGFVSYDDSPRRGAKGKIVLNDNPEKFGKYMKNLIRISNEKNKEFVLLVAWNEWGEGAYLEPDSIRKYQYLSELRKCLSECD